MLFVDKLANLALNHGNKLPFLMVVVSAIIMGEIPPVNC